MGEDKKKGTPKWKREFWKKKIGELQIKHEKVAGSPGVTSCFVRTGNDVIL